MSKEIRKGKNCFAEVIPWCPLCGELLETSHWWTCEGKYEVKCECGTVVELEALVVFSAIHPKIEKLMGAIK